MVSGTACNDQTMHASHTVNNIIHICSLHVYSCVMCVCVCVHVRIYFVCLCSFCASELCAHAILSKNRPQAINMSLIP